MLSTRPLFFVGSAREDLKGFPDAVQDAIGYALYLAQTGGKHAHAKPLRGFGSSRRGIETPRQEIDLVRASLRLAVDHHTSTFVEGGKS